MKLYCCERLAPSNDAMSLCKVVIFCRVQMMQKFAPFQQQEGKHHSTDLFSRVLFSFLPLCWPPLLLSFSRHFFALFSASKILRYVFAMAIGLCAFLGKNVFVIAVSGASKGTATQHLKSRGPKKAAFGKACLCQLSERGGLHENDENDKFVLTSKTRAFLLRPRENDANDENGGCHAGKGMVCKRHAFLLPDQVICGCGPWGSQFEFGTEEQHAGLDWNLAGHAGHHHLGPSSRPRWTQLTQSQETQVAGGHRERAIIL